MFKRALLAAALLALPACKVMVVDETGYPPGISHFGSQSLGGAVLPFSKAVVAGNTVYIAGELGIDPSTGNIVPGGTGPETTQIFRNISNTLGSVGAELSDVVKCTVYLSDMADYAEMNAAYSAALPDPKPARATVAVSGLAAGAHLEIDCIAVTS